MGFDRLADAPRVIIATGPLTAPALAGDLRETIGDEYLYFYDAISPIVYADSIDFEIAFRASRYEDGPGDYLNLPLDRARYEAFVAALLAGDKTSFHEWEKTTPYFDGCLPIEVMAERGVETLRHGPMKPVGLRDPRTGERPYAVVQLRQEDKRGILYNLVGFQTKLRVGEQQRILRTLPGLAGAVFARHGSVHRNTYINAPRCLGPTLELHRRPGCHLAGQIAGVEGYVESAALGGLAGIFAAHGVRGEAAPQPDAATAHGALLHHLAHASPRNFQPMNVNYGLFPPLPPAVPPLRKREKNEQLAARALAAFEPFVRDVACA